MNVLHKSLLILALTAVSSMLAVVLHPTHKIADLRPKVDLVRMIPIAFGRWHLDKTVSPVTVSPDLQEKLDQLYNQLLSRTYINDKDQRIMLSIAYGGDQSNDNTQVHRPEYCYTAQGFQITRNRSSHLTTAFGELPVRRLTAFLGSRNELITYWVTIGDKALLPGLERKLTQVTYGLTGRVPDGMLVRVSSIDSDAGAAYSLQDQFIQEMLSATDEEDRIRLVGRNVVSR